MAYVQKLKTLASVVPNMKVDPKHKNRADGWLMLLRVIGNVII